MQQQQEYFLFFSNFCPYSKEVVGLVTKKNIRNAFVLICVDTLQQVPPFVDRVPMIVNKHTKDVYADDSIYKVLDDVSNKMYPPVKIEAMPSTAFTAFQDTEFESLGGGTDSYSMLDMDNYRISYVEEDDNLKNKKADSSQLEQYISQRDADMSIITDRATLR